jgi:hypothetical protein
MRLRSIHLFRGWCLAVMLLASFNLLAAEKTDRGSAEPSAASAPAGLDAAMADYRLKLQEYTQARQAYATDVAAYWKSIGEKRGIRNAKRPAREQIALEDYVLTQPPVYAGPPEPVSPVPLPPPPPPPPPKYVPVLADFLKSAREEFNFVPQRPRSEIEFKRAYAKVAAAADLTKVQVVRIYGFEAGGNGAYDVQAGLEVPMPDARASTTALGYNQLLSTNTVEILAENGDRLLRTLKAKAATLAAKPKKLLEDKIEILQRMIEVSRSVPETWSAHEAVANTPQGVGMHALNLDIDVGPLLQTQKLLDSVIFARNKGYRVPLTAAELEMMNLTGDGNGFDMVTMPAEFRDRVPTSNFFQPAGYAANPVASRNDTVSKLIQATDIIMDKEVKLPGARALAAAF